MTAAEVKEQGNNLESVSGDASSAPATTAAVAEGAGDGLETVEQEGEIHSILPTTSSSEVGMHETRVVRSPGSGRHWVVPKPGR